LRACTRATQRGHTHFWHRDAGGVGAPANDNDGNDDDDDDSGGGVDDDDDDDGRAAHSAITTAAANVGIVCTINICKFEICAVQSPTVHK